jgi:hypothetical protein
MSKNQPLSEDLEDEVCDLVQRVRGQDGQEQVELKALELLFKIRTATGKIKPPAGKGSADKDMLARARLKANAN